MKAVVVVSSCGYVDEVRGRRLENWEYVTKTVECWEIDGFDVENMDYELSDVDFGVVGSWWERPDSDEKYYGDVVDLMVRYYYNT